MTALVVDTSVFVKWLNKDNEENIDKADQILEDIKSGKIEVIVPELIKYEVGNVLLKGKQLTANQAYISLGTAYSLPVTFVPESEDLAKETFSLANRLGITYYDASFLSIARQFKATLVTDDVKLHGKIKNASIKPLKDY